MGVYKMKLTGRGKPVLVRADSLAKAEKALVEGKALTAEQVEDALVAGDKVWKPGEELPADDPALEAGESSGSGDAS